MKTRQDRRCLTSASLLLAAMFIVACAPTEIKPRPLPPMISPPDFNSEAFRKASAERQTMALQEASMREASVVRNFYVGVEFHSGFFLVPVDSPPGEWVEPDFLDRAVSNQFYAAREAFEATPSRKPSPHFGWRLLCECTGVPWTYGTQERFIVRSAKLNIVPED